jgi:hypothetical protein
MMFIYHRITNPVRIYEWRSQLTTNFFRIYESKIEIRIFVLDS